MIDAPVPADGLPRVGSRAWSVSACGGGRPRSQAARGEPFVIAKAGKPIAIISPHREPVSSRPYGPYRGQIVLEDSFFEPMDDDFLSYFS